MLSSFSEDKEMKHRKTAIQITQGTPRGDCPEDSTLEAQDEQVDSLCIVWQIM